ncbi:MAG: hypothetical protein HONBIEJF_01890 [Fimbriimonadaceae bacterium]|nr:hypothetical protein [Fimbriimonadaceae bacterium]
MDRMPGGRRPVGTVTFLFTDIEGSTRIWESHPQVMQSSLGRHDAIVRNAIEARGGFVFKTIGDSFCAAFDAAQDAAEAAISAQRELQSETWARETPMKVRMAIHTGSVESRENDYFGPAVNRVARMLAAAHGSQTLVSLGTYELIRDFLPEDVTPRDLGEHRLKDLGRPETIYQLDHPDLPFQFPPLRTLDHPDLKHNLPQQVTSFVGRVNELREIKGLFSKARLLTMTGSGGSGKTRLAIQVAADMLDECADGVWLVELASLADPALVPNTIASALSLKEEPGKPMAQTLIDHLKHKVLLLVLDNCEHLLAACATFSDGLLRQCPRLRILATSRESLGITAETTFRVPSLTLPDPRKPQTAESLSHYEAVRLFIDRALQTQVSFEVTNENAPALASICHRLDGIPLAIELAAARVRSLSVEEINNRLDQRFRLLTGGSRTALPRQQTLRSLIDWSYDLLTDNEKALLRRLAVFAGGWTLEGAEAVCSGDPIEDWEVLELLTSLGDKSLAVAEQQQGSTRYRLLETVREYARDRIEEAEEADHWQDRHLEYFVALAEQAEPHLRGAQQVRWLDRLESEHDNFRAALSWSIASPESAAQGLRLAATIWRFWGVRGHLTEGRDWLARTLAASQSQQDQIRAKGLSGAGVLAWQQGGHAEALRLHQESLAIARALDDREAVATSLNNLGLVECSRANYDEARRLHEESLNLKREIGDRIGIAISFNNLANVAHALGNLAEAGGLLEESRAIFGELGDKRGVAHTLNNLGDVATELGQHERAYDLLMESIGLFRDLGDRRGQALTLNTLGATCRELGRLDEARAHLNESLSILRDLGDRSGAASALSKLARVAVIQAHHGEARGYLDECLAIRRELGDESGAASAEEELRGLGAASLAP